MKNLDLESVNILDFESDQNGNIYIVIYEENGEIKTYKEEER